MKKKWPGQWNLFAKIDSWPWCTGQREYKCKLSGDQNKIQNQDTNKNKFTPFLHALCDKLHLRGWYVLILYSIMNHSLICHAKFIKAMKFHKNQLQTHKFWEPKLTEKSLARGGVFSPCIHFFLRIGTFGVPYFCEFPTDSNE